MPASDKFKRVKEFVSDLSMEELTWLSGYIDGRMSTPIEQAAATPAKPLVNKITITYGTESGNSKKLASELAGRAKKTGIQAKVISLDQYRLTDLSREEYFLSIISTQGEGEPPAAAKKFYEHIHANSGQYSKLKYSVLALGDTSYPLFCKAGEDVDLQLQKLGGERIVPLRKCDVDYEGEADAWFLEVLQQLSHSTGNANSEIRIPAAPKKSTGRKQYKGKLLSNINLNDRGSAKQTHHIEIAADDLDYLPGDSLGMLPENGSIEVQEILQMLEIDGLETFTFRNEPVTALDLLKKKLNITYLPQRVVAKYAQLVHQEIPEIKIGLLDLLRIYPLAGNTDFGQLLDILEPLTPRLYSISSSPEAHAGEIHVTVARDQFQVNNEPKFGLCSDYLCGFPVDSEVEFYIHKNNQFRLPADDQDIIMIGPGTGIAPFRSFLAHREASGATGRNWLFFGDQHFVTDFLYQTEIQNWKDTGVLTQVTTAFSRDQQEKIYVQHKMKKHGAALYEWIEQGASLYICGAKEPMSVDVEDTLHQIIMLFGNKSSEEAAMQIEQLKEEGRYLKDVY